MTFLRKKLDSVGKHFEKGGKLETLYPLYEALDTFLYTPGETNKGMVQVRDGMDLKRVMGTVALALIPCLLMACYNTGLQANLALQSLGSDQIDGWRGQIIGLLGLGYNPASLLDNFFHGFLYFFPIFLVANVAGGTMEAIFAIFRKHEINEGFLVTGLLYPLTLPPMTPLWQVAIGIIFAVVLAKEVFGGTGKNFVNVALTGRAFLYFAYPTAMSGNAVWTAVDGYTGATILGLGASEGFAAVAENFSWMQAFLGFIPGSLGETSVVAALFGAVVLLVTGVASWRIMLSTVGSAFVFAFALNAIGSDTNPMFSMPASWHLVVGGFAFGAVFMATDPVTAPMNFSAHWMYGTLIGLMTILIRVINPAFPEGIMLAILFANVFAPTMDYFVIKNNIRRREKKYRLSTGGLS